MSVVLESNDKKTILGNFIDGYVEYAILTTECLERNSAIKFDPKTMDQIKSDCEKFLKDNQDNINVILEHFKIKVIAQDFWDSRNLCIPEGDDPVPFKDELWSQEITTRLTEASRAFGQFELWSNMKGLILHI
jgi:hypothetical protein